LVIWLALIVILSALASLWPAMRAAHLTVRDSLAYE
jgi:ABC-type lipoprotein release transport system permease subunit